MFCIILSLHIIIVPHNAVAQLNGGFHQAPIRSLGIEHGIFRIHQIGLCAVHVYAHVVVQHGKIEHHLHIVILSMGDGWRKLFRLTGFQLHKTRIILHHQIQSSLQAKSFAQETGFEHDFIGINAINLFGEIFLHQRADILELQFAIGKEFGLALGIFQVGTSGNVVRILVEQLLHQRTVLHLFVGQFIDKRIEKTVGKIPQHEVFVVHRRFETREQVVERMLSIIFKTF